MLVGGTKIPQAAWRGQKKNRNEVTSLDSTNIRSLVGKYYKRLYANTFNNLDKTNKLFERLKPPKPLYAAGGNISTRDRKSVV